MDAQRHDSPTDPDIALALAQARALNLHIQSGPIPSDKLHPVSQRTLEGLNLALKADRRWNSTGLYTALKPECIEVHIGPASIDRAIALLDALLHAFDALGMTGKLNTDGQGHGWEFHVLGERVSLCLREKTRRLSTPPATTTTSSHHAHVHEPTGVFELRLLINGNKSKSWMDTKSARIEDRLNEIPEAVFLEITDARATRAMWAKKESDQRDAERAALDAKHARQELLKTARSLLNQTANWQAAEALRDYAQFVRATAERRGPIEPGSRLDKWLAIVADIAHRLDPMTATDNTAISLDEVYPPDPPRGYGPVPSDYSSSSGRPTWVGGWWNRRGR